MHVQKCCCCRIVSITEADSLWPTQQLCSLSRDERGNFHNQLENFLKAWVLLNLMQCWRLCYSSSMRRWFRRQTALKHPAQQHWIRLTIFMGCSFAGSAKTHLKPFACVKLCCYQNFTRFEHTKKVLVLSPLSSGSYHTCATAVAAYAGLNRQLQTALMQW